MTNSQEAFILGIFWGMLLLWIIIEVVKSKGKWDAVFYTTLTAGTLAAIVLIFLQPISK